MHALEPAPGERCDDAEATFFADPALARMHAVIWWAGLALFMLWSGYIVLSRFA